jgi:hypothetical protein
MDIIIIHIYMLLSNGFLVSLLLYTLLFPNIKFISIKNFNLPLNLVTLRICLTDMCADGTHGNRTLQGKS